MLYHSHILQTCSSAWHWRHSSRRRRGRLRSASETPHFQQTSDMAGSSMRRLGGLRVVAGGDFVIAFADELDQADAMTEWVGKHGDLAPGVGLDIRFQPRAR